MATLGFLYLAIDSIFRDLKFRKISNLLLIINFISLINFWDYWLLLLSLAPFLTRFIGAGDLKLVAVLYLYSKALHLSISLWPICAALIGILTALIMRKRQIPFAPGLIFGILLSDYLARRHGAI